MKIPKLYKLKYAILKNNNRRKHKSILAKLIPLRLIICF
jgi:hypothetical protein